MLFVLQYLNYIHNETIKHMTTHIVFIIVKLETNRSKYQFSQLLILGLSIDSNVSHVKYNLKRTLRPGCIERNAISMELINNKVNI